ncbi:GNAT family N-acetyltransferase [Streptomyces sp. NPDC127084]|uniref:GNAT family N-acetyltransferase n=1 Tax=Streptomyces sp. NPDC127084 TaxID=3347133 RepID=UPI00365F4F6C
MTETCTPRGPKSSHAVSAAVGDGVPALSAVARQGISPRPGGVPAPLLGRGYAAAATAAASRAALVAGADAVLLFTDLANPTSNALYQRIGYRPVIDFAAWEFSVASAKNG